MEKKNIITRALNLVLSTIGAGITTFSMLLLLFKTEEVVSLLFSKSVVLATGIMIGAIVGFITGAIFAYRHASKEIASKEKEISSKETLVNNQEVEIARLNQQLADAEKYVRMLVKTHMTKTKHKKDETKRGSAICSQIADFPVEDEIGSMEEEEITHPQEETSDDES